LKLIDKVVSTNPLAKKIKRRYAPGDSVDLKDDRARKDWIKLTVATEYHPIGTVTMGQATDERLRVLGMKGLRVIDASVMPLHVSANPVATVYAIAEKGSDLIKEVWSL
jgi:choline dehydrogenase-like flavoprotein